MKLVHFTICIALIVIVSSVNAQNLLLVREDGCRGGSPSLTVDITTPEIEICGAGVNTDYPDYEIGRLYPVKAGEDCLLAGGYFAWWPKTRECFVEPFAFYETQIGTKTSFRTKQGWYLPLNGGPEIWYSSDTSINSQISNQAKVGLVAHWAKLGGSPCPVRFGPKVSYSVSDTINFSARYCPWGGNAPDDWQVETCITF